MRLLLESGHLRICLWNLIIEHSMIATSISITKDAV